MRWLRRLSALVMAVLLVWLGGLAWFLGSSLAIPVNPSVTTDAIVALTGGKLRLETGVALLAAGKAKQLFISGVNQRVDRNELLHALGPAAERVACCIVLGHQADDTLGNARETADWMHEQGYRSLRLVTSWYHMRRSLLEFTRTMPWIAIVPHPVYAHHVDPERWWGRHGALALVVVEYQKYVAACLRPLVEAALPPRPKLAPVIHATAFAAPPGSVR